LPLPPEVERTCFHPEGWGDEEPAYEISAEATPSPETARALDAITDAYREGIHRMIAAGPLDVATPETEADAYVGDLGPAELSTAVGAWGPTSNTEAASVDPDLFDRSADHWREDTLLGMPAVTL
jgi:hypothetical protein